MRPSTRQAEGSPRRPGSPLLAGLVFALTALLFVLSWKGLPGGAARGEGLPALLARVPAVYAPLRLQVLEGAEASLGARMQLRDLEGRPLSLVEGSWEGRDLVLECWILAAPRSPAVLVFPRSLGAEGPEQGAATASLLLYDSYAREGFPAIFSGRPQDGEAFDAGARKTLAQVFSSLQKADSAAAGRSEKPAALGSLPSIKGYSLLRLQLVAPRPGGFYELRLGRDGSARLVPIAAF